MRAVLERWARRVWDERDEAAIDEMLAADTVGHGLMPETLVGPEEFKQFHRLFCARLPTTGMAIDHFIEAEGWFAALCTFTGTTPDGRPVRIHGQIHGRIGDGRILEAYNHFDFVGLFVQLGSLPSDIFGRCLAATAEAAQSRSDGGGTSPGSSSSISTAGTA